MLDTENGQENTPNDLPHGNENTGVFGSPADLRDWFAGQAMQAIMARVMEGGDVYDPAKIDADFVPDDGDHWFKMKGHRHWVYFANVDGTLAVEAYGKAHRLVTTYEQRLSREAFSQADAMLSARKSGVSQ